MRLFFSVPLPQEAKDRAARALAPARAAAGELSWTKPEQMHLTLAFLGEQPPEALERIYAAAQPCTGLKPFEATLSGAGAFPNPRRAHVLWLGIIEGANELVELAALEAQGLLRSLETQTSAPGAEIALPGGERLINFSSNDYLGLAAHPAVGEALSRAGARWGSGASASRLVCGDFVPHHELENALARFESGEAAVL